MKIQLITLLCVGACLVSASQPAFAISEQEESIPVASAAEEVPISVEAVPVPVANGLEAVPVSAPNDSETLKPLYTEIPFCYEYPATVNTFIISQDREAILREIPQIVTLFKQAPGTFNNLPRMARFTKELTQIYFETFVESYPTLLDFPISSKDFWYLTILAISVSSMQFQSRRFFFDQNSNNLMALIIASLVGDVNIGGNYSDYFSSKLSQWPAYITNNISQLNSFYTLEVLVFLIKKIDSSPRSDDFRIQVFRKIVKKSDEKLNYMRLFNIKLYENPSPVIMKLLNYLHLGYRNIASEIINMFIDAVKSPQTAYYSRIMETFHSKDFRTKFMESRNVLDAFSQYFSRLIQPSSSRHSDNFKELFDFLLLVFMNANAELRVLHSIFSKNSPDLLTNYEFSDVQYASPYGNEKSETSISQASASSSAAASVNNNHFNNVIFDPNEFAFSLDNIYLSCLNPGKVPSRLVIPFLVFFALDPPYTERIIWDEYDRSREIIVNLHLKIVKELLEHDQINPYEMFLLVVKIGTKERNYNPICEKVGDLFKPVDYLANPQKWINLRALLKTLNDDMIESLLATRFAKPAYVMFFPDKEFLYDKWIITNNNRPKNWQYNISTLDSTRMEVRIGNYPNSYQLVENQDPIFASVYPLSLAIILGNENAIKALLKYKSHLSKEHLEQAEYVATILGSDLFARCNAEITAEISANSQKSAGKCTIC